MDKPQRVENQIEKAISGQGEVRTVVRELSSPSPRITDISLIIDLEHFWIVPLLQ